MTWNLFVGYQVNRHFALEGGYSAFGDAVTSAFMLGVPTSITSETTAFELTGLALVPLSESFSLYGKAGFFRYDSDGVASGGIVDSGSDKNAEYTIAAL